MTMKAVLISIQPKWVEKIASGEKTIKVRKTRPKIETPFKCYIYCTMGNGVKGDYLVQSGIQCSKVIGEFICDRVYLIKNQCDSFVVANEKQSVTNEIARQSCLDYYDMVAYLGNKNGYGWHISDLKIYDKPKELSEFFKPCPTKEKGDCLSCDCLADNDYGGVCTNNLIRPPQSYMFVEDLG